MIDNIQSGFKIGVDDDIKLNKEKNGCKAGVEESVDFNVKLKLDLNQLNCVNQSNN